MKTVSVVKRLLLIEDNEQDEILTVKAFESLEQNAGSSRRYQIDVRRDGEKAIEFFMPDRKVPHGPRPGDLDLILLDLNLPKFSGFEVLKKIRGNDESKQIPVVVLSTSTDPEDIRRSYELGANSFLKKPVDYQEFTRLVDVLKDYWLNKNQVHHSLQTK